MRILGMEAEQLRRLNGYYTCFEMNNQPVLWLEGVKIINENRVEIENFLRRIYSVENLKIYLVGAGSSAKAASIVESYLKRVTGKEVTAVASTALLTHPENFIVDDSPVLLVSLGSSGNTTEGLEAVEIIKEKCSKLFQLLLICSEQGELIKKYSGSEGVMHIPIPIGTKGKSFAATGEFTLLVQYALMILDIKNINYYENMFNSIMEGADIFFREDIYKVHAVSNNKYDTIVALGSNVLSYLASEMCLKVSELSAGLQSTQYHSILEFRHGPKLVMNSRALLSFFFSNDTYALKYEMDMLKECYSDKRESTVVGISMDYNKVIEENCDYYFYFNRNNFKYIDDSHLIFLYSLYLQSVGILKSISLNISPDMPDKTGVVNKVAKGVKIYRKRL